MDAEIFSTGAYSCNQSRAILVSELNIRRKLSLPKKAKINWNPLWGNFFSANCTRIEGDGEAISRREPVACFDVVIFMTVLRGATVGTDNDGFRRPLEIPIYNERVIMEGPAATTVRTMQPRDDR